MDGRKLLQTRLETVQASIEEYHLELCSSIIPCADDVNRLFRQLKQWQDEEKVLLSELNPESKTLMRE